MRPHEMKQEGFFTKCRHCAALPGTLSELLDCPGPAPQVDGRAGATEVEVRAGMERILDDQLANQLLPNYDAILLAARKRREEAYDEELLANGFNRAMRRSVKVVATGVKIEAEPTTEVKLHRALSHWDSIPATPALRRAMLGGGQ